MLCWGNLVSHLGFSETAISELPFRMQSAQSTEGKHSLTLLVSMTVLLALVFFKVSFFLKNRRQTWFLLRMNPRTQKNARGRLCPLLLYSPGNNCLDCTYAVWLSCLGILLALKQSIGLCLWVPSLVPAEQLPNVLKLFQSSLMYL